MKSIFPGAFPNGIPPINYAGRDPATNLGAVSIGGVMTVFHIYRDGDGKLSTSSAAGDPVDGCFFPDAINATNDVAGRLSMMGKITTDCVWHSGTQELATGPCFPGGFGEAYSLNDAGMTLTFRRSDAASPAFVFLIGQTVAEGPVATEGPIARFLPIKINNRNQVLGMNGEGHLMLRTVDATGAAVGSDIDIGLVTEKPPERMDFFAHSRRLYDLNTPPPHNPAAFEVVGPDLYGRMAKWEKNNRKNPDGSPALPLYLPKELDDIIPADSQLRIK